MRNTPIATTLIYVAFLALIGFAVYFTQIGFPLFALLLTPTYKHQ